MNTTRKDTIVILILATLLAFVNASSFFGHDTEAGLLNYMARATDLLQQDPTRSLSCFNKYIPLINEIANNYETNFKACLNESEAAIERADDATLGKRNDLATAAEASCALLVQCPEDNSVEEIFQCYIDGGSVNIQTMYIINANASQELAALREQYYLIKNDEFKCTNETKRAYEKKSAEAYAGLNNCILGNSEPSTTAATTTNAQAEPTVAPDTTNNPIITTTKYETTEEITSEPTALPDTSGNPISSTAKSETTEEGITTGNAETSSILPGAITEGPTDGPTDGPTENTTNGELERTSENPIASPTESAPEETTTSENQEESSALPE